MSPRQLRLRLPKQIKTSIGLRQVQLQDRDPGTIGSSRRPKVGSHAWCPRSDGRRPETT